MLGVPGPLGAKLGNFELGGRGAHVAARENPDTLALLRAVLHMILVYAWPTDGVDAA